MSTDLEPHKFDARAGYICIDGGAGSTLPKNPDDCVCGAPESDPIHIVEPHEYHPQPPHLTGWRDCYLCGEVMDHECHNIKGDSA